MNTIRPIFVIWIIFISIVGVGGDDTDADDLYDDTYTPVFVNKVVYKEKFFTHENFTELMVKMVEQQIGNDRNLSLLSKKITKARNYQQRSNSNCSAFLNTTRLQIEEIQASKNSVKELNTALRVATTLSAACFAMFAKLGFSARHVGMATSKCIKSILLQEALSIAMTCAFWWILGWGLAFGDDSYPKYWRNALFGQTMYMGGGITTGDEATDPLVGAEYLLQLSYAMLVTSIPPGATAERATLALNMFVCAAQTAVIYPAVAHVIWHPSGWASANRERFLLFGCGAIDYGGSVVIHITAGATALAGCLYVGQRDGRWIMNDQQRISLQPKSQCDPAMEALGTFIIFASLVATNGAAPRDFITMIGVSSRAMSNSLISGGAGCLGAVILTKYQTGVYSHQIACGGLIAGVVAGSSGCAVVDGYQALGIGFGASVFYYLQGRFMLGLQIDDVSHAAAIHLLPGCWGAVATGLFAKKDLVDAAFYPRAYKCSGFFIQGETRLLQAQATMIGLIIAWVGATATFVYYLGDKLVGSRYDLFWEKEGTDFHIMGGKQEYVQVTSESKIKQQVMEVITNKHNKEAAKILKGIQSA